MYIITPNHQPNVQLFQFPLPRLSVLRAEPQCAAAHPSQRVQTCRCVRARGRVCPGVLLHIGLRERTARFTLNSNSTMHIVILLPVIPVIKLIWRAPRKR